MPSSRTGALPAIRIPSPKYIFRICFPPKNHPKNTEARFRQACEQDGTAIREFNRIVMGPGGLFVDLPENRRDIPHISQ